MKQFLIFSLLLIGLATLAGSFRIRRETPSKESLLARAKELETKAAAAVTELNASGHKKEAEVVSRTLKEVQDLVKKIGETNNQTELSLLLLQLDASEAALQAELKDLNQDKQPTLTKESLLTRAKELETKANASIVELTVGGHSKEAETVAKLVKEVEELIRKVSETTDQTKLATLLSQLQTAENSLEAELKVLNPRAKREAPAKESLLARAKELETKANAAVTELNASGHKKEAEIVSKTLKDVEDLVKKISGTTNQTELSLLLVQLDAAEAALETELKDLKTL